MKQLHNLVISSGGITGISYIGMLKYLDEYNLLDNIHTYVGSSVGAIFCLLLTIEYNWKEIYEFCYQFDFSKLIKETNLDIFLEDFGFEKSNRIVYMMKRILEFKNINTDITFLEHYNNTKKKLVITGTCINERTIYYFNYLDNPNMKILDAIHISTCIPILFTPVKYDDKLWVDGAIIDSFPISYCYEDMEHTLGLTFQDCDACECDEGIVNYLQDLIKTIICGTNNRNIKIYEKNTIIYLNTLDCNLGSSFKYDKETKKDIFETGYKSALEQHDKLLNFIDDTSDNEIQLLISEVESILNSEIDMSETENSETDISEIESSSD